MNFSSVLQQLIQVTVSTMPLVTGLFIPSYWAVVGLVFALIIQYQPLFRTDVQQLRKIDAGVKIRSMNT